jgi:hypothetical protein
MYSLWKSGFDFKLENVNTDSVIYTGETQINTAIYDWTVTDVYNWIISLRMNRSLLIANAFKEEEIDGEVLLVINKEDVLSVFRDRSLGMTGLFWLAVFKLRKR